MKIPRIQEPQQSFVAGSGARPLSARVNPGAMAAPGQALAQLGNTLQDITSTWLNTELTIRNQQEVAKAKSYMATKVDEATQAVKTIADPKKAEAEYTRLVKAAQNAVNKGGVEGLSFTTGSARRSWQSEASTLVSNGAKTVRTTARTLMAETAVANTYEALDQMAKDRANATSQSDQKRIEGDMLFSVQMLQGMGQIDPKEAYNLQKKYLGKSDQLLVEKQLLAGEENKNPGIIEEVYRSIQNPNLYSNLTAEARQNLSERALDLRDSLERKIQADEVRRNIDKDREIKRRQASTFGTFYSQIVDFQQDKTKPEPSLTQIKQQLRLGNLTDNQYEKLIDAFANRNQPTFVDPEIVKGIRERIRDANGPEALKVIEDDVFNDIRLDIETQDKLKVLINEARERTPKFIQSKQYAEVLKKLGVGEGILDRLLPGAKERFAVINAQYEADIIDGRDPTEAFNSAIDAIRASKDVNIRAIVRPRVGAAKNKPVEEWTKEDVSEALEAAKTTYTGKIMSYTLEVLNLRALELVINNAAKANEEGNKAKGNQPSGGQFKSTKRTR